MLIDRCVAGLTLVLVCSFGASGFSQQPPEDDLRTFQFQAVELKTADWIHWGDRASQFTNWTNHSNRLIPVYSFGISLKPVSGEHSCYRDANRLKEIYGRMPESTLNRHADYFDQTDIYRLQKKAWEAGKKNIILMVFDGMDWNTTQAAAIYKNKKIPYTEGRGTGLAFLDYRGGDPEFGFCVTSPSDGSASTDVNAQVVTPKEGGSGGGYSWEFGGKTPWEEPGDPSYLLGKRRSIPHPFTDSASSAASMNGGTKTYNSSINFSPAGEKLETLAHQMQQAGRAIGIVTNVPISHATPACVYAHNVSRNDYQDISRDLLGIRSISHRDDPLPGVDVLIGCGWGELRDDDRSKQGNNYVPGNKYLADDDIQRIDQVNGGKYVVAQRTPGRAGTEVLAEGVALAAEKRQRFLGFFGTTGGHLPFQTADGRFDPTRGVSSMDVYEPADISENPSLADMTEAALNLLKTNEKGFYLMVEAGDVDWANHNNNIDDAIGAVFSGDAAFTAITEWVETNSNWDETCLIVTADHGHMMVLDDPSVLTGERKPISDEAFVKLRAAKLKDSKQD